MVPCTVSCCCAPSRRVKPSLENRELIQRYSIRYFKPLLDDARIRAMAGNPAIYQRLMIEMSDYLAFREDKRIAALLFELLQRRDAPLSNDEKKRLLERAGRYNTPASE